MFLVVTPLLRFDSFRMGGGSPSARYLTSRKGHLGQDADVISIFATLFCERLVASSQSSQIVAEASDGGAAAVSGYRCYGVHSNLVFFYRCRLGPQPSTLVRRAGFRSGSGRDRISPPKKMQNVL
jgi:hypothetical protein